MAKNRLDNLRDRKWVGSRLQEFVESQGKTLKDLASLPDLTNANKWGSGGAAPTWPALVALVEACNTTLEAMMRHIDPSGKPAPTNPKHAESQRKLKELLEAKDSTEEWSKLAAGNVEAVHRYYRGEREKSDS